MDTLDQFYIIYERAWGRTNTLEGGLKGGGACTKLCITKLCVAVLTRWADFLNQCSISSLVQWAFSDEHSQSHQHKLPLHICQ